MARVDRVKTVCPTCNQPLGGALAELVAAGWISRAPRNEFVWFSPSGLYWIDMRDQDWPERFAELAKLEARAVSHEEPS